MVQPTNISSRVSIKKQRTAHRAFNTRNGKRRMAETSLNTTSIDKPIILNGSRISHTMGNKMIIISASGQHKTKRIHHKIRPIKVRILE